jgi:SPP1 family predicted phage head-tail adaptor
VIEVAGRLSERVTLSSPIVVDDGEGGRTRTWLEVGTSVPASVESLRGDERIAVAASETTLTHRVMMRWRDDVTAKTRITWGARTLEVVGPPIEHGRLRLLECLCAERIQDG